ncbi:3-oxoacyl-[acyl-carrier-protein] synthase III C-terminal domain-containing protein [Nocardia rhizosphaerae]|uniref:3-oxoacyl-[acyl-carrier-protein] synthase III C-terminal domain-containing protein n=1 Tax=Nocardia rhizosphaerae TaxID=1691571 RepID=A0ABV8LB06_9NOCA
MGVRIRSTGTAGAADTTSIVELSGQAARDSLRQAGIRPDQVGVLINTGIFRDSNTVEPAVSALIQKAAGIGLDYTRGDRRTFSFDLMNGAVGVLNAVQVAGSILATGSTEHVLIVAGDTHPSLARSTADAEFPYATAGAALLLEQVDGPEGFGPVRTARSGGSPAEQAYVDIATMGTVGRSLMTVDRDPDFEDRILAVATDAGRNALAEAGIDPAGIALIASTPAPQFPKRLADALGIDQDAVLLPDLTDGDPHTAALPLAFHRALAAGTLAGRTHVLFVAAGAGPSAAAALYHLPETIA